MIRHVCPGLPDTTPNISFTITRHLQATSQLCLGEITLLKTSQRDISPSCLCHPRSFWIANDKWCSEEKSYHHTWQWRALKNGNNGTLDWSFWRSHLQLLLKQNTALFYSEGFRWAQWVWADLKNNEVDVLFYRLNNEVVCFREQPSPLFSLTKTPSPTLPSSLMKLIYA